MSSRYTTYDPATHEAAVIAEADSLGEDGVGHYPDGWDWDTVTMRIEDRLNIELPNSWDHPIYRKIKAAARKAHREAQ